MYIPVEYSFLRILCDKSNQLKLMKQRIIQVIFLLSSFHAIAQPKIYDVMSYGAINDGVSNSTHAIQLAIDDCNKNGGGTVYVPSGTYKIGTIFLKSNINLYLERSAVLKGSEILSDYFEYALPPFGKNYYGLIFTDSAFNVSISGYGTIDGNNQVFFDWTSAKKIEWGGSQFTRQKDAFRSVMNGIGDGPVVPKARPRQMVVFSRCKNVQVQNIQLLNAPFWTLHFADCDGVNVSGIYLATNMLVPNADGIDVTSCNNVIISNCDIRAGDDAIAITGYDHHFEIPGFNNLKHVSENILISNCNLQSNSSAIRIGFLDQNTVKNVQVANVNITNSNRGIGLFVRDEGSLENISFQNMYIETALKTGDWWGNGEPIHISAVRGNDKATLGKIKHVRFNNIVCKGENGILLYGSKESILEDIQFNHVRFELIHSKLNELAGGNIDLRGCALPKQLFARDIPAFLLQHVKDITFNDVQLNWTNTSAPFFTHGIELNNFSNVRINLFNGTASPANKKANRIKASNGKQLFLDNKQNSLFVNVIN